MITIETTVSAPVEASWHAWTSPQCIIQWNFASEDWTCPRAEIDLRQGGKFNYRMEAKDGSMGFDFEGTFTSVIPLQKIEYLLGDVRKVVVEFVPDGGTTRIVESFEAEDVHTSEQQKQGWQSILNHFKNLVERIP